MDQAWNWAGHFFHRVVGFVYAHPYATLAIAALVLTGNVAQWVDEAKAKRLAR